MIQGILNFQFILNQEESGEIEPEFRPIKLIFHNKKFNESNYTELISTNDIFGIFYQHTTGIFKDKGAFSNFYTGRLKETPYQVVSYYRQETDSSKYLTISFFELDDEVEIFQDLLNTMAKRLLLIFKKLININPLKQISLLEKIHSKVESELKFTIFQIDRLSQLDKLQKASLIFHSDERLKILEILRERPIAKKELKGILERMKPNINIDVLLDPFLELNLIRRDWIKGEKDKETGIVKNQGEYLFLTKDILLARLPNENILNRLRENKKNLYDIYKDKVADYFLTYDVNKQSVEELKKISGLLLNPDSYDFLALMRNSYYPLDKLPKIFSDWFDIEVILSTLEDLKIVTT
ncbi:unnamed protein product, partial [marine sediment metagenome]